MVAVIVKEHAAGQRNIHLGTWSELALLVYLVAILSQDTALVQCAAHTGIASCADAVSSPRGPRLSNPILTYDASESLSIASIFQCKC